MITEETLLKGFVYVLKLCTVVRVDRDMFMEHCN